MHFVFNVIPYNHIKRPVFLSKWEITHDMSHDAELVQRRLPVEEDDIAINHVSLNHVTVLQLLSHLLPVTVLQKPEPD